MGLQPACSQNVSRQRPGPVWVHGRPWAAPHEAGVLKHPVVGLQPLFVHPSPVPQRADVSVVQLGKVPAGLH